MVDLGINMNTEELNEKIENGQVKGLIIMDDNLNVDLTDKLEFIMVQGEYYSILLEHADVVMPSPSHAETVGTMTSQDRRVQNVRAAIEPGTEMTNIEQIQEIMKIFTNREHGIRGEFLLENIGKSIPEYLHVSENINYDSYWPIGKSRILYTDGYHTADGKANFTAITGLQMYSDDKELILLTNTTEII
jgi:predicted molibdopterin-dependent oxidoreductase YjgC